MVNLTASEAAAVERTGASLRELVLQALETYR
jgi:hypothetical protein